MDTLQPVEFLPQRIPLASFETTMPQYIRSLLAFICLFFACLHVEAKENPDWTTPLPPFQIADNLYYVGSRDLAAYLITTPAGNILINANLESSPPTDSRKRRKTWFCLG